MKNGEVKLYNSCIDIDGDSEIGEKILTCHTIYLKGEKRSSMERTEQLTISWKII